MALYPLILSHLILNICFGSTVFAHNTDEIHTWCQKTPHPVQCQSLLLANPNPNPVQIKTETEFVNISVRLSLARAVHATKDTYSLGQKCRTKHQKSAWVDCLELYDHTIHRLNQTVSPTSGETHYSDVQTWLSSALTSLYTCQSGFRRLGLPDNFLPSSFRNLFNLVSNALAINQAILQNYGQDVSLASKKANAGNSTSNWDIDVTVAKDGSGDFPTIEEAVMAAKRRRGYGKYVIYIKEGVYEEYIKIGPNLKDIMLIGDGVGKTIITGDKSHGTGYSTLKSATFAVLGDRFIARDITFRNTAGPGKGQAVAMRSDSDRSVYYRCSFEGYHGTLYIHSGRQFFRECNVSGTVDFIFGNAAVVFQECQIFARNPPNWMNTITAHSRFNLNQTTGIIIDNSIINAAPELKAELSESTPIKTYLGRPRQPYARTVFMTSYLGELINPSGWVKSDNDSMLETVYYGEYENRGPGSDTANRVKWPGFHVIKDDFEASRFSVVNFINGMSWIPRHIVPFSTDYDW